MGQGTAGTKQSPAWPEGPPSAGSQAVRSWLRLAGPALRAPRGAWSPRAAAPGKWLSSWEAPRWALSGSLMLGYLEMEAPLSGLRRH